MRLSVRWSAMPNSGSITLRASNVTGSRPIGSSCGTSSGRIGQAIPTAGEKHAEFPDGAGRTGRSDALDREALAQRGEQRSALRPFRSLTHAVVVEDGHLVMREDHRQEIAVRAGRRRAPAATREAAAER